MMKKLAWVLLLAGCYEQENGEPWVPDRLPDAITQEGMLVFYDEGVEQQEPALLDQYWLEAQQCIGIEMLPPVVHVVGSVEQWAERNNFDLDGVKATHNIQNENVAGLTLDRPLGSFIVLDEPEQKRVWKHEFIHILMSNHNFTIDENSFHQSSLWECQYL